MIKKILSGLAVILLTGLFFTGCSSISDYIDENSGSQEDTGISSPGIIKYSDGTLFGITRSGSSDNGGYQIYSSSTNVLVGSIQRDGQVTTTSGASLGICSGARLSDEGLRGECILSTRNPSLGDFNNNNDDDYSQGSSGCSGSSSGCGGSSGCSGSSSSHPAGCEDRRDGKFKASWSQSTCNQHGYFYCTVSHSCTNQTININSCNK